MSPQTLRNIWEIDMLLTTGQSSSGPPWCQPWFLLDLSLYEQRGHTLSAIKCMYRLMFVYHPSHAGLWHMTDVTFECFTPCLFDQTVWRENWDENTRNIACFALKPVVVSLFYFIPNTLSFDIVMFGSHVYFFSVLMTHLYRNVCVFLFEPARRLHIIKD